MRKLILIIISSFFVLGAIFFFTFSPNSLKDFVPKDADFYFHLNLNEMSKEGQKTKRWLEKFWPQEAINYLAKREDNLSLLGLNLNQELLPLVSEIGLVVKNDDFALIIFLKKKTEFHPFILKKGEHLFFYKKFSPRVFAVSSSLNFFEAQKEKQYFAFSAEIKENGLIFKGKNKDFLGEFGFSKLIEMSGSFKKEFILVLPGEEPVEKVVFQIKEFLAWREPIVKKSYLPFGEEFEEIVVDPELFKFEEKKLENFALYNLETKRISLAKIGSNLFFSNSSSFLEENIVLLNFSPVFYLKLNLGNLKKIFISKKNKEIRIELQAD